MMDTLKKSFLMLIIFMVITGFIYPLCILMVGQWVFPARANGSILRDSHGEQVGSKLIGQKFESAKYFQDRPSACGYDTLPSGATNYGLSNPLWRAQVRQTIEQYQTVNQLSKGETIPVDAVMSSGSGLDPDISLNNAMLQSRRIAQERKIPLSKVQEIIRQQSKKDTGLFQLPLVNVLELNLELDRQSQGK